MENQKNNPDVPMTDEELDQFVRELSQQVEEPTPEPEAATAEKQTAKPAPRNKQKPSKKPAKKAWLVRLILFFIFAAVLIVCLFYFAHYGFDSCARQAESENMASVVASIQAAQTTPATSSTNAPSVPTYPGGLPINPPTKPTVQEILPEYLPFFEQNPDLVGWIKVEDTKINYPVLQSSPDNKDYYIDHDFYHRPRGAGAIYVRETCDVFAPSDNVTIYGHHMKDMSMFAGLDYYVEKSFWETHQTFTFDTLFEHHTYQVMAIFRTSANIGEGFSYHQFENAADEEEFNVFIDTVKALALYDTGVDAQYGDKMVCLSTCEYSLDNGRLVLVAKRIT